MIVESIKFLNFGPFYGEQRLIFPSDGRGVHIIRGENGQGKTSILRGILWGLYGTVHDRVGDSIRPTSLLNRTAQREGLFRFGIAIQFSHEGERWTLTRRMEARSFTDRSFDSGGQCILVKGGEVVPNADQAIARILPSEVSRFFFFDGEMLQDYEELLDQSDSSKDILRGSIELVLGVPYLLTACEDLAQVQHGLEVDRNRLLRRLGGEDLTNLADELQKVTQRISDHETRAKDLDGKMAKLDLEITEKKRRLTEISQVKDLAERQIALDGSLRDLEADSARAREAQRKLLTDLYKTVIARSSEDIIERLRRRHESTMNKYNEKMRLEGVDRQIQQAIDAAKCRLCGTVLDGGKLKQLKGDLVEVKQQIRNLTEIPEPNIEFEDHVNRLEKLRSNLIQASDFRALDRSIQRADHDGASKRAELEEVKEKLKKVDADEPRRIAVDIQGLSDEKGRLKSLKDEEERARASDLDRRSELERKLDGVDQDEVKAILKRVEVVKPLSEVFEQAIAVYRDEKRKEVEKESSKVFKELRTKKSFSHLNINPQFGLNIITDDGQVLDRAEWRSSGEEQVVALALIGALNHCAQVSAPVFMDTPFARLDIRHGEKVLRYIPRLSPQVVLFVTDREFRPGDESHLAGSVTGEFTVLHRGEKEGSMITPTRVEETK